MRQREVAHRRLLLSSIGALLFLIFSPLIGHHMSSRADAALMGKDHVGALCVIALHTLLAPLHSHFHMLLFAGLVYAVIDRTKAAWRLRVCSFSILCRHCRALLPNYANQFAKSRTWFALSVSAPLFPFFSVLRCCG